MNLFRSEEHAKNWHGFKESSRGGLLPVEKLMEIFSTPLFRERPSPDYILRYPDLATETLAKIREITSNDPFWHREG